MRIVIAALTLSLLAAPAPADESVPPGQGAPPEKLVTLERTNCLGTCPSYTVTVFTDGKLEYVGRSFVKHKGARAGRVDAAQLAALEQAFKDADYFSLADKYTKYERSDNPYCNTSFNLHGRRKAIDHYYGDHSAPAPLVKLEGQIDEIVRIERFIGTDAERDALEKQDKLH
jgi:Domain of unknown function (DUF6438)